MSRSLRQVEVVYCDDIRQEVGSKLSYMGIYTGDLLVPSAPLILPKLCIAIKVTTGIEEPWESLQIRVLIVKDEQEIELATVGPISFASQTTELDPTSAFVGVQITVILSPFQIEQESKIRVIANMDSEEIRGAALRIRVADPSLVPAMLG